MPAVSPPEQMTAAYQRFINWKRHEELVGTVKFGTRGRGIQPEKSRSGSRNLYRMPVDLCRPAPLDIRPKSASGGTTYHYRITSVSKTRGLDGTGPSASNPAIGYEHYVSDPEKAEQIPSAASERYVAGGQEFADGVSRTALIISSIGNTLAEREAFWRAVWAFERTPGIPTIELTPLLGKADDWDALVADPTTPALVAEAAQDVIWLRSISRDEPGSDVFADKPRIVEIELAAEEDIAWAEGLRNRFGKLKANRMVHYREPRGGLVQQKLEIELPEEFGPAERYAVAADLARDLDAVGVPYTIVVHAPDHRNNERNYHIHILIYPGRCRRDGEGGWIFEAGPGSALKLRPGDIQRQLAKPEDRLDSRSFHNLRAGADMMVLRTRYAEHCNRQLDQLGVGDRRYDPRSFEEMGIDQKPGEHLGTDAARMAAVGVPVDVDLENARKIYEARLRQLEREDKARRADHKRHLAKLDAALKQAGPEMTDDHAFKNAVILRREIEKDATIVADGRAALDRAALEQAVAVSGAERVETHMRRLLDAIAAGTASAAEVRDAGPIRRRLELAEDHLAEIAEATTPLTLAHAAYEQEIISTEASLDRLCGLVDKVLVRLEKARERHAAAASGWAANTILPIEQYPVSLKPHAHCTALIDHVKAGAAGEPWVHVWQASGEGGKRSDYIVHGLRPADAAILDMPGLQARIVPFLQEVATNQEKAVGRVLDFVEDHGATPLIDGMDALYNRAPTAVLNLYKRYHDHPLFLSRLAEAKKRHSDRLLREFNARQSAREVEAAAAEATVTLPTPVAPAVQKVTQEPALPAVVAVPGAPLSVKVASAPPPADPVSAKLPADLPPAEPTRAVESRPEKVATDLPPVMIRLSDEPTAPARAKQHSAPAGAGAASDAESPLTGAAAGAGEPSRPLPLDMRKRPRPPRDPAVQAALHARAAAAAKKAPMAAAAKTEDARPGPVHPPASGVLPPTVGFDVPGDARSAGSARKPVTGPSSPRPAAPDPAVDRARTIDGLLEQLKASSAFRSLPHKERGQVLIQVDVVADYVRRNRVSLHKQAYILMMQTEAPTLVEMLEGATRHLLSLAFADSLAVALANPPRPSLPLIELGQTGVQGSSRELIGKDRSEGR